MLERFDRYFSIKERGSSFSGEVVAGVSTFLALAYIFVVNPAILSQAGIPSSAVLFATILGSAVATIVMGLWARLPFVLAPGMEMNSYVAFFIVGQLGLTWQEALGAVFWSGVLFLVLTGLRIRHRIIASIPARMKAGLALCVGAFIAVIGLRLSGVLVYSGASLEGVGPIATPAVLVMLLGLAIACLLERFRLKASVLVAIGAATGLCFLLGLRPAPAPPSSPTQWFEAVGQLDLGVIANPRSFSVVLILFIIDFYGSIAKFIGLTESTSLMQQGRLPRISQALWVDGAAIGVGSILGTTNIITYVESAVGIGAGARTGLAAIVCGLLMLTAFALMPIIALIPVHAATGVLLLIGFKLIPSRRELSMYTMADGIILSLMLITVVWTFAIDRAMLVGFAGYFVLGLLRREKMDPFLAFSTTGLLAGVGLQMQ